MPREFGFKENLMHKSSELWLVDEALQNRAEWFIENSGIERYLKAGGRYLDVGTGKGHITQRVLEDMEKAGTPLAGYYGIDVADKPLKKVQGRESARLEKITKTDQGKNPMGFAWANADALPFPDGSLDGASYVFSVHHMNREMTDKVLQEAKRVTNKDGYIFIAEDLASAEDQEQMRRTAERDDRLNWGKGEHNYKSDEEWKKYFDETGLELVANEFFESETKKGPIPHGFYVLRKKQEDKT